MGLNLIDRRGVGSFAQGGIYREYLALTFVDVFAVGNVIRVSPALFDSKHQDSQVLPSVPHWKLVYSAVGEFTMTPSASLPTKYKNVIVKIKFYNTSNFEIKFEWMGIADTGKYLYLYNYSPFNLWFNQAADKTQQSNVYNSGGQTLGLRVTIDTADTDPAENRAFIQVDTPVQGTSFQRITSSGPDTRYYLELSSGKPTDGFELNKSLVVKLRNFPRYTNSEYYVGIARVDQLKGNNGAFPEELNMEYAKSAGFVSAEPFELTTNFIPRGNLKNIYGFRYEQFESIASFMIDGAYWKAGASYNIFVITKEECTWKSYLLETISQRTPWVSPTGTHSVEAVTLDGYDINLDDGVCMYNVPYGCEVEVQFKFNFMDLQNDMIAKGLTGRNTDYFVKAEAYISNGSRQTGYTVPGQTVEVLTTSVLTLLDQGLLTYKFKIPEDWKGQTRYLNADWIFDYGNGEVDHLIGFFLLHVSGAEDTIELTDPDPLPESFCDIDAIETDFYFTDINATPDHKFVIDLIDNKQLVPPEEVIEQFEENFNTELNAGVRFDYPEVKTNSKYCINMRGFNVTIDSETRPCTDLILQYNKYDDKQFQFSWNLDGWLDDDINFISFVFRNSAGVELTKLPIILPRAQGSSLTLQTMFSPILIDIHISRIDGSDYVLLGRKFYWSKSANQNSVTFEVCDDDTDFKDCAQLPLLTHSLTWNFTAGGGITNKTVTMVKLDPGVPDTEVMKKIVNGVESDYTGPFNANAYDKVELIWRPTYPEQGCDLELYDCITEYRAGQP